MKRTSRILLSALAVAVLLGGAPLCPAQQDSPAAAKPMVTVAFSGYDEILKDVEFIGKLAGNPQLAQSVQAAVQQGTGGQGLAGLDPKRPWGFVVQAGTDQFPMFAFVPVTDLSQALAVLGPLVGQPNDIGDGVLEIEAQNQTIYVKEKQGGWAFIARSPDVLAGTPADPTGVLDGLHEQYDLAVRISVANVPPTVRQRAMGPIQMGAQMGMQQRLPDETDQQHALRTKMVQQGIEQFQTLLDELDTFLVGLAVDRTASTAYLDYVITALEGTKTAEQMAQNAESRSDFAGFALPGAAVTLNAVSHVSPSDVDQAKTSFAPIRAKTLKELETQGLPPQDVAEAKKLVGSLFDVLDSTIEGGRIDVGMSLLLDPDALTFVAGAHVGDTAKLDTLIKDVAGQVIKEDPAAAEMIKLDAEQHQGVRLHVLGLPTAEMAAQLPNLPRLVGDTLDVVVGIGPQSVYLAAGRNAAATLKQAIDQSKAQAPQQVPPMRLAVSATPVAKFIAVVARDRQAQGIATMVGGLLEQAGDKDHLTVTTTPVPGGIKVRLELEEGLLKVIGSAPMLIGGGPGAAGP